MTPEQIEYIITEIRAAMQKPAGASTPAATVTGTPDTLPKPDQIIDNAADVTVHFGKNAGTPLSALSDKQLLWYGSDRPAQLKNDGTPFSPRQQDITLKNACRTIWHQRQGSIPAPAAKPEFADPGDENRF